MVKSIKLFFKIWFIDYVEFEEFKWLFYKTYILALVTLMMQLTQY